MSYRKLHHAKCSACGYQSAHSDRGTFITPFFLPSMCSGCGSDMQKYNIIENRPHWLHVKIKQKWKPGQRSWNPSDWFGYWVTIEKNEGTAY